MSRIAKTASCCIYVKKSTRPIQQTKVEYPHTEVVNLWKGFNVWRNNVFFRTLDFNVHIYSLNYMRICTKNSEVHIYVGRYILARKVHRKPISRFLNYHVTETSILIYVKIWGMKSSTKVLHKIIWITNLPFLCMHIFCYLKLNAPHAFQFIALGRSELYKSSVLFPLNRVLRLVLLAHTGMSCVRLIQKYRNLCNPVDPCIIINEGKLNSVSVCRCRALFVWTGSIGG